MRIVICTKETPDTAAKVDVAPDGSVTWGDAPLVINPWDEYAVEEALLLGDRGATATTVVGVGGEDTKEALKHALAMGVEEAILISDPTLVDADTLVTSRVIAQAVRKLDNVGLVMLGKITTDGGSGQTPAQVGWRLGWTILTYVSKIVDIDFSAGTITVERLLEEGKQVIQGKLPAVVSVVKDINEPRYPSFMGIRKASRAEIPVWGAGDLELDGISPKVKWVEIESLPPREGECQILEGETVEEAAGMLADKLIEEKVV
nr:electron transfer flavoprotein subunit beta/FixA family protein [Anaerolineae bacterium]